MSRAHIADPLDRIAGLAAPRHDDPPETLSAIANLCEAIADGLTTIRGTVPTGGDRWAALATTSGQLAVAARQLREEATRVTAV